MVRAACSAMTCLELEPGVVIGSYRLIKEIGRGGMGAVYEAVHTVLPRRAAVKVMHAEHVRQPGLATRVVQEAALLEDLRHAGLVRVFECNVLADLRPWIAMELIDGESLAGKLARVGALSAQEVATLLAEVADILVTVHCHRIVHRDLKPDNLLLVPEDRDYPLRLIDWGVARFEQAARLTLDGSTPGTPVYMAPEQLAGLQVAAPCDLYALGVIGYEALAGVPPFDGGSLAEIVYLQVTSMAMPLGARCRAPAALCALIHRLLDKDPACRPTAVELRREARAIASSLIADDYAELEIELDIDIAADATEDVERDTTVVDVDDLEGRSSDPLATLGRPRWTPRYVASVAPITPRHARDQVSGEITTGPEAHRMAARNRS